MRRERGLTVVEMIVVVTVFVMLAAVAVPRFAFLSEEARIDAVRALADDVRAASELTRRVWESAGRPASLTTNGQRIELRWGYPTTGSIRELVVGDSSFQYSDGVWRYQVNGETSVDCAVRYRAPMNPGEAPEVSAIVSGC